MSEYRNQATTSSELETLHGELADLHFVAGWNRPGAPPMWASPKTSLSPAVWHYADARDALSRAGRLVSTELAERRNLILVNPQEGNRYPTLRTQVVAYQMLLPGEHARTHRHSPHAGRLILDADDGAYTIVDGTKIPMRPGDVVLTPGGSWHGHGHDGSEPAYWIDFLDVPLVQMLEPMFFHEYPGSWQQPSASTRESPLLFPWDETQARLDAAEPDPTGRRGRYVELGSPALPTIGLYMQRLEPGAWTKPYRTTANWQMCIVEGSGESRIADQRIEWSRGDVVVAPCWATQAHHSADGATVLVVTDEPLQRYCGYLHTAEVTEDEPALSA